ncbi:N-acetylmuramoyl-L-alanine amidase [Psychrobacillus sp. NEAU-3TGS]|uniref:N-acetylmuramoyl-L-alanine amidase family protein n=1 Tax=Psychrobacillus sp. NEAU-3TGS TaxID=2995412 RepID=UPI0024975A41|nr:N-acetylmuramoyl-L-alanine amidase [Psychrobacillus sp. NEAU-3TGS]MDI2588028.1 N-acetylmuramoyl-L-alanine amidase [Psychrobacillus sp. NEAU-3TGS]
MVKVFIDAGHGGSDPGAVGNGLKEKDITLKIAKRVDELLKEYQNVQTKMSRTGDTYPSLTDRTNEANNWGANFLLSIHINAGGGNGYEDYVYPDSTNSIAYQNIIHAEIIKKIGQMGNRGKKQANYHMLRESNMPSILTECGFIDNSSDAALLKQDAFIEGLAQGHVNGLVKSFGLIKKEVGGVTEEKIVLTPGQKNAFDKLVKHGLMAADYEVKDSVDIRLITMLAPLLTKLETKGSL